MLSIISFKTGSSQSAAFIIYVIIFYMCNCIKVRMKEALLILVLLDLCTSRLMYF